MKTNFLGSLRPWHADLVIDLGSANTRVLVPGQGIVFDEPTLCCFEDRGRAPSLIVAGRAAAEMIDRTSGRLRMAWPLRRGVLTDMAAGRALIQHAVRSAVGGSRWRGVRALIGVPADATPAERQSLLTTAADAGLSARLAVEPIAAAIGAGLPVGEPIGSMIIECGAGTTEVAVLAIGHICLSRSVRIGGDSLDCAIVDHLQARRRFLVSTVSAERIKRELVGELDNEPGAYVTIAGRSLTSQLPETLEVPVAELVDVMRRHIEPIVSAVRSALANTPPELSRDIHDRGIFLTGGSAIMGLVAEVVRASTGLKVQTVSNPMACVITGLGRMAVH